MRCPSCGHLEDKVIDSRTAEEGRAIRRRRECESCSHRFTTFERAEEVGLMVEKRSGIKEPLSKDKLMSGVLKACKNRPIAMDAIERMADDVIDSLKAQGRPTIQSADLGKEILERLRGLDEVAYLRFASVYKDFKELNDFERELGLLQKKLPPKQKV